MSIKRLCEVSHHDASATVVGVNTDSAPPDTEHCKVHPDRPAGVLCQRCGAPMCPQCMHQASVGYHCPDCAQKGSQKVFRPADLITQPVVTITLIAINVVVFLIGQGRNLNIDGALIADALVRTSDGVQRIGVADGQWYRIVTAAFLHAGLLHVAVNMWALWILGPILERALGRVRFGVLYAAAATFGALGVMLLDPDKLTVGASGAIYGLMGALFAMQAASGVRFRDNALLPTLVLNVVVTVAIPNISIGGHIGGFIGGAAVGYLYVLATKRAIEPPAQIAIGTAVALAAAVGAVLIA